MMLNKNEIIHGYCTEELRKLVESSVDLIYLDPPFFTQKDHSLTDREANNEYTFTDKWNSLEEYISFIESGLIECKRVLKNTGSIFLHCDKSASHHIRVLLDKIFGSNNFQSEIIWAYKRWSNSKKGLLNTHQNIYFYSKTADFKFNTLYNDYSPSTNVDQILQARAKNSNGKSIYLKGEDGNTILGKEKKGVPLSDVWNIPFLNPKAKERVGYPTQKPVLLLQQIIRIVTDEGDLVIDPFCGSGTTCVAAKSLKRDFLGIDKSIDAVNLSNSRLQSMIISQSQLLENGEESYIEKSEFELSILNSINAIPVQRNAGIDGYLKEHIDGRPVPIKIQNRSETIQTAKTRLSNSTKSNNFKYKILIKTNDLKDHFLFEDMFEDSDLLIIDSYDLLLNTWIKNLKGNHTAKNLMSK